MLHLTKFDEAFYGRTFVDRSLGMQTDLVCIGYGDNQGNPFFIGMYPDTARGTVNVKTVLMKSAEFTGVKTPKP